MCVLNVKVCYPPAYQEVGIQHVSPNSGRKTYTPLVSASIKPNEGMIFENIEAAESFSRRYALAGGFSIRKGTQRVDNNVVRLKYFVCTKEGSRIVKEVDTLSEDFKGKKQRRNPSQRTNCEAQLRLNLTDNGKYMVKYFGEAHNHPVVDKDDINFLAFARELMFTHKKMLDDLANINIGPVKAFNIMRTMYVGFDKVGATKSDFKNYKRIIN
ncbi:protein FAR1-RELATED SEQUENCE 5-like [Bidens hawaiensis]|uniref:protein FAR1-RELATED SEQUENCE 5-like n=1 Tax=Bidens hawaiensis TaxID=980011 RepID=UPI0040497A91